MESQRAHEPEDLPDDHASPNGGNACDQTSRGVDGSPRSRVELRPTTRGLGTYLRPRQN
jgi:hypothetical protein